MVSQDAINRCGPTPPKLAIYKRPPTSGEKRRNVDQALADMISRGTGGHLAASYMVSSYHLLQPCPAAILEWDEKMRKIRDRPYWPSRSKSSD